MHSLTSFYNDVTPNYKDLDFDGIMGNADEVVSLKTYQPKISTEKTLKGITDKINTYANKLSKATLDPSHVGKNRVLDFVIKKGEWDANMANIEDAIEKIQDNLGNVIIRVTEFKIYGIFTFNIIKRFFFSKRNDCLCFGDIQN
ncbi:MAG: hypothetical protein WCK82_13370 [Bacteroidota bacterium]